MLSSQVRAEETLGSAAQSSLRGVVRTKASCGKARVGSDRDPKQSSFRKFCWKGELRNGD